MIDELHPTVGVRDIVSPYQRQGGEWMWALATHPAVLNLVEELVGSPNVLLWSGGPGCKQPALSLDPAAEQEDSGLVPLHQDAP
jgi:hypothetical protein